MITSVLNLSAQKIFEQGVVYDIDVTLNDSNSTLKGNESIIYTNNSPDTLKEIYVHLYPNAYNSDKSAFSKQLIEKNRDHSWYFAQAKKSTGSISAKGYITDIGFSINEIPVSYAEYLRNEDIAVLQLPQPLLPNQSITIRTAFTVQLPKQVSRSGRFEKRGYSIAQWYPKMAMYDKDGWHPQPYLENGEYYSNFGKYDIKITLPKEYLIAATGEVQEQSEKDAYSDRKRITELFYKELGKIINIDTVTSYPFVQIKQLLQSWPEGSDKIKLARLFNFEKDIFPLRDLKTVSFKADSVLDFAWFAHNRLLLENNEVILPNGKKVQTNLFYNASHLVNWHHLSSVLDSTIIFMSRQVGEYPYPQVSVIDIGSAPGGGMEYPMVTSIGNYDRSYLITTIAHEIIHNWFYGILASNERDHAFMDEGFTSFYENRLANYLMQGDTNLRKYLEYELGNDQSASFVKLASEHKDQIVNTTSNELTAENYGRLAYTKTSTLIYQLEQYLGKENFEKCIKAYYQEFNFMHPQPEDLERVLKSNAKKNIDWFFVQLNTTQAVDFALRKTDKNSVVIKNKTGTLIPTTVNVMQDDSLREVVIVDPFVGKKRVEFKTAGNSIIIDNSQYGFDRQPANNSWNRNSFFHKVPIKVKHSSKNYYAPTNTYLVTASPALGFNIYDGVQVGAVIGNFHRHVNQHRFRFMAAPFLGTTSKQLNGNAIMEYHWFPKTFAHQIQIGIAGRTYSLDSSKQNISKKLFNRFSKINPYVQLQLNRDRAHPEISKSLLLYVPIISQDEFGYQYNAVDSNYAVFKKSPITNWFANVQYRYDNVRLFNPFSYAFRAEAHKDFAKITAVGDALLHYNIPNKGLHVRAFAGKFFDFTGTSFGSSDYWLFGTATGEQDYTMSQYFLGRSAFKGLASRQLFIKEGGMKVNTSKLGAPIGLSDNWMLAFNFESDFISKYLCTVRPFADVLITSAIGDLGQRRIQNNFAAGLHIGIYKDIFSIYIPFLMSKDYADYFKTNFTKNERLLNKITYSFDLQKIKAANFKKSNRWTSLNLQ